MTAEQNFDWLDKQVEGLLNDFEGGESTLQETKNGFYEIIFDKLIKQIQEQQDYKQEIDEACKKQREIINDNIGGWKESMGFAIQHAIEQQEQEYREEYFLGREEAFKYAVRMHDEHFNAPSPLDKEV